MSPFDGGRKGSGYPPALKRLGQNFLVDANILRRVADALDLESTDTVVEIGAGRGALTEQLAARCARVITIEIDRALVPLLREKFATAGNVEVIESDALDVQLGDFASGDWKLVGNVPYYITTPLIFHALRRPRPTAAVFMVQREVAERAAASTGAREYGALSVNLQALARVELLFTVPATAFVPRPTVESAVIRLTAPLTTIVAPADEERFRILVQRSFSHRRKQMQKILRHIHGLSAARAGEVLAASAIEPTARPETLSPEDFARLLSVLQK